jgi:dipeptidyl-peptidase-4
MGRMRRYWWSPDGSRIAACRVDEGPVQTWWIADATSPDAEPYPIRYPRAGTANADVTLHVVDIATGGITEVVWDREGFEYLAAVGWDQGSPLTLLVQSRDQRRTQVLEARDDGSTIVVHEDHDPAWVDLVDGSPARLADGTLVVTHDGDDRRRISIGDVVATPASIQVDSVIGTDGGTVWFRGWEDDPTEGHVFRVSAGAAPERVTTSAGDHFAVVGGPVIVVKSYAADDQHPTVTVRRNGGDPVALGSNAEDPVVDPRPSYAVLGERGLRAALLLPGGREPGEAVPVLLSPYGGPHHGEVLHARGAYRPAQWFADRLGAAVLVIDGRGTPGRGAAWDRAVHLDFSVTLQDQVDGLRSAAERWPFLDLERVAIRGWSFGGMLSALAVCTRPDVFHAAVAGAPVTDQRLYDTHYTERYLGKPHEQPEAYRVSSPLSFASDLRRPLLLIHGLADDNVVAANTLQMSARLFEGGIAHDLVLLPNASHMGGSGDLVAARYLAELDFLRRTLDLPVPS